MQHIRTASVMDVQLGKQRRPSADLGAGTLEWLQPAALQFDDRYMRPLNMKRLSEMRSKGWRSDKAGTLYVSRRDTGYWCIDGRHRCEHAKIEGIEYVPCFVYQGLSVAREAELYAAFGDTFDQTALDRFKARLIAGEPVACDVADVVARAGLTVRLSGHSQMQADILCVATLEEILLRMGASFLGRVLTTQRACFHDDPKSLTTMPLMGMAMLLLRYPNLDLNRLIARAQGTTFGHMKAQARGVADIEHITGSTAFGQVLRKTYNQRLSPQNQLGDWVEKFYSDDERRAIAARTAQRNRERATNPSRFSHVKLAQRSTTLGSNAKH